MKRFEWVEPALIAQVKFTEWNSDDQLCQPVFLGLRTDKQAKDVARE
jgi:bifunctional non-homologous end joining protein LigD